MRAGNERAYAGTVVPLLRAMNRVEFLEWAGLATCVLSAVLHTVGGNHSAALWSGIAGVYCFIGIVHRVAR
jgi:hypothetical protein